MFTGEQLSEICDLLGSRNAFLYHACHLQDFYSYLSLGGIASRQMMESKGLPFTEFASDKRDKQNGIWNLIFGNFKDFGWIYHLRKNAIPNPYGPILIKIDWKALQDASNMSITLRSAGARDFNMAAESLKTIDDVSRLFLNDVNQGKSNYMKFKTELETAFPGRKIGTPEWSMDIPGAVLSVNHFARIIVDPICHGNNSLFEEVRRLSTNYDHLLGDLVARKRINSSQSELVAAIGEGVTDLDQLKSTHANLRDWASSVEALDWQFKRFAAYTREGTLSKFGAFKPPAVQRAA